MKHYFANVPGLGNVAVSRHAQQRIEEDHIPEATFVDVLMNAKSVPDGLGTVWREANGVRICVVLRPEPFRGATLVITVYRVGKALKAKRGD